MRGEDEVVSSVDTKEEKDSSPDVEVDIVVNNIMCSFSVRCHLNLKEIALAACNVEYHKAMAMLNMKFRRPPCTASIRSSGKITMTGTTTETDAKVGARRCARVLQKLGYNVKFTNYRIVNVLATCTMPFAIKIADFASAHPKIASYEPELHPGVTYKMKDIKATLKIFSTGSITITAARVETVQAAVEEAYRLVYDYRKERRTDDTNLRRSSVRKRLNSDESEQEDPLSVRKKRNKLCSKKWIAPEKNDEEEKRENDGSVRLKRNKICPKKWITSEEEDDDENENLSVRQKR